MSQSLLITLLLLSSLLSLSLINYIINRRLKKSSKTTDSLLGSNILKAIIFVCSGLLISEVGNAGKEVMNLQFLHSVSGLALLLAGYLSLFFSTALIITFVCIWFSTLVFSVLTKGKNIYDISANNEIADVILFAGILICITFVVKPGILGLLLEFIRYSGVPSFH